MAKRKSILYLGEADPIIEQVKTEVTKALVAAQVSPLFVQAITSTEASLKIENQRFDTVVVDIEVKRFIDNGFVENLNSHRNLQCDIIALTNNPQAASIINNAQIVSKPLEPELLQRALIKSLMGGDYVNAPAIESKYAVDARVLNAMIKATLFICQQFGLSDMKMQKPELKQKYTSWQGDIGSYMDIKSQKFNGTLIVSFEKKVYLSILENMLGEKYMEIDDQNADAIGEINNMILGNAKSDFTQYQVEMTLPKILKKGDSPAVTEKAAGMLIPFELPQGKIYIEVIANPAA